jgi:hypothetical protein
MNNEQHIPVFKGQSKSITNYWIKFWRLSLLEGYTLKFHTIFNIEKKKEKESIPDGTTPIEYEQEYPFRLCGLPPKYKFKIQSTVDVPAAVFRCD